MARSPETDSARDKRPRARRRRSPWRWLRWGAVATVWASFFAFCLVGWLAYDLPDLSKLEELKKRSSVTLLAADGTLLASYGDLYGGMVTLPELPPYLAAAVIATEDRRFYRHGGLDPRGLARAMLINLKEWRWVQGGSTITQQLAKNVFLTPARTLRRKGQEVLLALWLERNFSKEEILTLYLNRVYLGAGTYGVDAAARRYFGKPASEVTLYEAALLAALLKAPSRYNPLNDKALAEERARLVLANMVDAEMIDAETATIAAAEGFRSGQAATGGAYGQYFSDWVLDQLPSYVGFADRDLVVTTTLLPWVQRLSEDALETRMRAEGPEQAAGEAALISMSPDGAVRALVGGRDYGASQFNRATQALRQPGSAFKPIVYLAAFERGLGADSRYVDAPISIGNWAPSNYNDKYYGEVTLREALARSLNSVAAQLIQQVGVKAAIDMARRLGINAPLVEGPSLALGSSEVSLLELTGAYAVMANGGYGVFPYGILEVRDRAGELLYSRTGGGLGRVVSAEAVRQLQDALISVIDWGTGKNAQIGRPIAGKTGTTQEYRDAWFVGYSAELVTGVWVGNDDSRPMDKVTGGGLPAKLWQDFMLAALANEPVRPLPLPAIEIPVAAATPEPAAADGTAQPESALDPAASAADSDEPTTEESDSFAKFIEDLVIRQDRRK